MGSPKVGPVFDNKKSYTVPTHNSDTLNCEISQNSDNLFALTKMSLFWEEEDFAKKVH